ncbi:MAG: hypothetical protein R6X02_01650 [Enhygromyxa sp.]
MVAAALAQLSCGPRDIPSPEDSSAEDPVDTEGSPTDLPAHDPRWCIEVAEETETRIPMSDLDNECGAELTAEACEANPACTAVFGRPVQCPEAGACLSGGVEFLGCIPFVVCLPGAVIYCRETQGYLLTYASMQGGCVPFWMMNCMTSPDYAAMLEAPPDCD